MDRVELVLADARAGSARAVARLLSIVDDRSAEMAEVMRLTAGRYPQTHVVGVTGSPGVGKSTLLSALVGAYRACSQRVAVLAVDPSSPFSGGALLGDRVRMAQHATDSKVFVRSLAARGQLGGLSATTAQAVQVLAAVGFDVVLVETVGVGQSEVDVRAVVDTSLVLVAPGMGDGIQAAKAGVLEIADILVVTKDDLPGAAAAARDLRTRRGAHDGWDVPVLRVSAEAGRGVDRLVETISAHAQWLRTSGALTARRRWRADREIRTRAAELLLERLPASRLSELSAAVADGRTDAWSAAAALVAEPLDAGVVE